MHSQGMVHGDLKGVRNQKLNHVNLLNGIIYQANILVDQTCRALLADFGLVTIISDSATSTSFTEAGSIRWMSPELLDPDIEVHPRTKCSDCYALGMVIYEVLSQRKPFFQYKDVVLATKVVKGDYPERPQEPEAVVWFTDDVWEVLECCWAYLPEGRPSVEDVLKFLEGVASSWTPPSFLSTVAPSPVSSPTSTTFHTASEGIMDVDGGEESSPSHPSGELPQKDDTYEDTTEIIKRLLINQRNGEGAIPQFHNKHTEELSAIRFKTHVLVRKPSSRLQVLSWLRGGVGSS